MTRYSGGCHCGRIAFEVEGEIEQAVDCNCSYHRRTGALLWWAPRKQLLLVTPEADLGTYLFNKKRIRHHYCALCGAAPFAEGFDRSGTPTAAINVRCVADIDLARLKIVPFDGRSL